MGRGSWTAVQKVIKKIVIANRLFIVEEVTVEKMNKTWHAIWLFLFVLGCSSKSGVEETAWFDYALKYSQAQSKLAANKGAIRDFNKMSKLKEKFLQSKQPTETEIISVLRSPDKRHQTAGLAAMSLRPIETYPLIEILFEYLQHQDPEMRWYAVESLEKFTRFPESKKTNIGEQLLQIVKTRKDNELTIQEFSLLAKFPSEEVAQFLTEQLMKEGKDNHARIFRYAAFRALKKMDNLYYDKAAEYVKNHGSPEIIEELLNSGKCFETKEE